MRSAVAPIDLEPPIAETVADAGCPHMAILLESEADVPPALASFYGLGLRRGGYLFHRALPGRADDDRRALADAGLDVPALEREGRMEVCELPIEDPPETWAEPWLPLVERELRRGFDAVWWSRFPLGAEDPLFQVALEYDRHWEAAFHGRSAVSLCVYIVGGLPAAARAERLRDLRAIHDGTITVSGDREAASHPRAR